MTVILDFKNVNTREEFYDLINSKFEFEYIHSNLDSLYDELTCICYDLIIVIKNLNNAKFNQDKYFVSIKQLFDDLSDEIENINVKYVDEIF